jgi:phosphopantetheine--protein transferase-like protein
LEAGSGKFSGGWFMKSNLAKGPNTTASAFAERLNWASPPASDIVVASCVDDENLSENDLLSLLPPDEFSKALAMFNGAERRHFVFRRCFQRIFLAEVLGWQGQPHDLRIEHKLDSPPRTSDAPSLKISFSSAAATVVACAAFHSDVGIDVEKLRSIENSAGLSSRFFTAGEAEAIARLSKDEQDVAFLHFWTAKEAGLKAIGKGIVSGLNTFVLSTQNNCYVVDLATESVADKSWTLQYLDFLPFHIVALMHRSAT